MQKSTTWREFLGTIIIDPSERQKIAEALGVNPVTLLRWVANKSNPRPDNLRVLADVLVEYRQELISLIAKEYPFIAEESQDEPQQGISEIPGAFYSRVLNIYTTSPLMLRSSSLGVLILKDIIERISTPYAGIEAILVKCSTATVNGKVRSLRTVLGRGTPPFLSTLETVTLFLGAESQAGRTISSGRFVVVQSEEELERLFPDPLKDSITRSRASYPILQADQIAGCLVVSSTARKHFSARELDLLQQYANLLALAFEPDEFYSLKDIELGIMPSASIQMPILASFSQRVTNAIIEASRNQRQLTRIQAENVIWNEIEEEILAISDATLMKS